MSETKTGYKLKRPAVSNGWIFIGTTHEEVASAIVSEIEMQKGMSVDECDDIVIEAFEITQQEIDDMPEFPGW